MEIENLDDYLYEIRVRRVEYAKHYPDGFWRVIAEPWFMDIGPAKAKEYGFEAFLFLGPRAHIVDICGCHFRWRKLTENAPAGDWTPSLLNAVRDGFGYGVILSVMTGIMPGFDMVAGNPFSPEALAEALANDYWHDGQKIDDRAVTLANAIPVTEFFYDE
jgi:hypothetical protein